MSFEIKAKDVMGRIGLLKTRRGVIETPYMYPVINPVKKTIPLNEIKDEFKMNAVITNAYLVKKYFNETAIAEGVHKILDFEGVIMTDSGAYQLLIYGKVEVTPKEIVEFQEKIGSDIAVILDYPTGGNATKKMAEETVKVTIERATESEKYRTDDTILWVGPIQGGTYLDLIAYSAKEMSKLDFDIFALGSPTQIMERYEYDTLVDMIVTAKMNLPPNKPLHLFGGGHPMIFAFAVALGVDLFDSASYALYARADRYITPTGTIKLMDLHESICNCPICRRYSPDELKTLPKEQREKLLARHNLYVTILELNRIKQAIREGRLWEYMAMKARAHPKLLGALKRIKKYASYIEQFDPVTKKRALFYTGPEDSYRPEVIRHREYLKRYIPPLNLDIGVLIDFYALKNKKLTCNTLVCYIGFFETFSVFSITCSSMVLFLSFMNALFFPPILNPKPPAKTIIPLLPAKILSNQIFRPNYGIFLTLLDKQRLLSLLPYLHLEILVLLFLLLLQPQLQPLV